MLHIGGFGLSALLAPASVAVFLFLVWIGRRIDAEAFLAALAVCLLATFIAKLAAYACDSPAAALGIVSPSGHSSFSAVFYGCVALLLAGGRPRGQAIAILAAAGLFVLLIGVSRVVVEAHTGPDVVAGLAIGVASLSVFQKFRGPPQRLNPPLAALAIGAPAALLLLACVYLFARHWSPEPLMEAAGMRLGRAIAFCGSP